MPRDGAIDGAMAGASDIAAEACVESSFEAVAGDGALSATAATGGGAGCTEDARPSAACGWLSARWPARLSIS